MKKVIIGLVLALSLASSLQAHFFAYQEWLSPDGKTVLEEYYDIHQSNYPLDKSYSVNQQNNFLNRAKKNEKNVLVLVEDRKSFWKKEMAYYSMFTRNVLFKLPWLLDLVVGTVTPLCWLYDKCLALQISCTNLEFRHTRAVPEEIRSRKIKEIKDLLEREQSEIFLVDKNPEDALIESLAYYHINSNSSSRKMMAAGGAHFTKLNLCLLKKGWQPGRIVLPRTLSNSEKEQMVQGLNGATQDPDYFFELANTRLCEIDKHAIDFADVNNDIPLNRLIKHAPGNLPSFLAGSNAEKYGLCFETTP